MIIYKSHGYKILNLHEKFDKSICTRYKKKLGTSDKKLEYEKKQQAQSCMTIQHVSKGTKILTKWRKKNPS